MDYHGSSTVYFSRSAAAADGASLVEDDTEDGEQFDFDDSDDSSPDPSHLTAEASDRINTSRPGSEAQDTAKPDVNGPTGRRLAGKSSLYHQCSNSSGMEMCTVLT